MEQHAVAEPTSRKILVEGRKGVVDDWASALKARRYEIHRLNNGSELWPEIRTFKPDVLVLTATTIANEGDGLWGRLHKELPKVSIFISYSMRSLPQARALRNMLAHRCVSDFLYQNEPGDVVVKRIERVFHEHALQVFREALQGSGAYRGTNGPRITIDTDVLNWFVRATAPTPGSIEVGHDASRHTHQRPSDPPISVPRLAQLYHGPTGRMDAQAVAEFLGIPLTDLAVALGAKQSTVRKTPHGPARQSALEPIVRSLEMLSDLTNNDEEVRRWLNKRHPDLGDITPLKVIMQGKAGILWDMLQGVAMGGFS